MEDDGFDTQASIAFWLSLAASATDLPVCIAVCVRRKTVLLLQVLRASCLDVSAPPRACRTALRQAERLWARSLRGSRSVLVNDRVHVELEGPLASRGVCASRVFPPRHVVIPVTTRRGFYAAHDYCRRLRRGDFPGFYFI